MKRNPKDIVFVSIQLVLFVIYLFRISPIDFVIIGWIKSIGLMLAVGGCIVLIAALITLNKNLSPFPTPKQTAELIQTGLYKYIRHPIYTGILFMALGYGLYSENTLRLIIFVLLIILFKLKATYEEHQLQIKFSDYAEYKKTSGMFLPKWG
ncbi:MAG: isoprenylcysteine carboxylmethyltransferase family protein [Bacteroidetes bacterium]|nr:isoprenylcysteine carboxylmethyltransferase family protein [Bacteroidota bacterium]